MAEMSWMIVIHSSSHLIDKRDRESVLMRAKRKLVCECDTCKLKLRVSIVTLFVIPIEENQTKQIELYYLDKTNSVNKFAVNAVKIKHMYIP